MMHDGKVLVVEDEPVILLDLDFALTNAGFNVVATSNAAGAIEAFDDDPATIRALVADIRLGPGKRGWDVARHLRQANPSLPVVYATGDTTSHWGAEGVSNSIIIWKPFFMAQIVTAISTLINAQRRPAAGDLTPGCGNLRISSDI